MKDVRYNTTKAIVPAINRKKEQQLTRVDIEVAEQTGDGKENAIEKAPLGEVVLGSGMVFMCLVLMMQGMPKVPTGTVLLI